MPILIVLKNPRVNLIAEGGIKDEDEKKWDEIFHGQMLMIKNQKGRNSVIPLAMDCNIAVLEEVTQKEIDEQEKMAAKRREQAGAQGGGPGVIAKPHMLFPSNRGGRG